MNSFFLLDFDTNSYWPSEMVVAFISLFLILGQQICSVKGAEGFYNIAHMTNTKDSVHWAIANGANSIEVDLAFTSSGNPDKFCHSPDKEACDCTCICPAPLWVFCTFYTSNVCSKLLDGVSSGSPCGAQTGVGELLEEIAAQQTLALVIIDSKIDADDMSEAVMSVAGNEVVSKLVTHLFGKGYGGKVIIGSPKLNTLSYLKTAAEAMNNHAYKDRTYYSVDMEKDNIAETLQKLHTLPTSNIVYGTGISSCSPSQVKTDTMKLAALNKANGVVGMSYLWTIDKESTIEDNIHYVQGVMTNYPFTVYKILYEQGITLATQTSEIPPATSSSVITSAASMTCDCDYHPGGCSISQAAPSGFACHCKYKGGWTCGGDVVQCKTPSSQYCTNPDTSIHSCLLGNGDCEGYKTATCDCDYHPGGCSISQAPPANTACNCKYKGGWTCGGDITRCTDESSHYCKNPDTSVNTCVLGGGDCSGYQQATCDCDYHPGGCAISRTPPSNTACKCRYKGGWTCGGEIVRCRDFSSPYCTSPDSSIQTCLQGDGDCEGYKSATCDCDYKRGGCVISQAPPQTTACKCSYKGWWTCGGHVTRCMDDNNHYCKNPDKSLNTCRVGGGDCGGY